MPYYRSTILHTGDGEDNVRQAILKLDDDLKNVFGYLNVHEADTTAHGITGAIVGTGTAQTLTNKTLTAPVIEGGTLNLLTQLTIANDVDIGNYKITAKQFETDIATGTAPMVVASTTVVTGLDVDLLRGNSAPSGDIVGTTDTQVLTNKTLTSGVLDGDLSGTAFLDENDLSTDSATKLASQQSIKAYMDQWPAALTGLVAAEIQQLQDIGVNTIAASQWGYLGISDQGWAQTDAPTWAGVTVDGTFSGTGVKDEDDMSSDSAVSLATQQSVKAYVAAALAARGGDGLLHKETKTFTATDMGNKHRNCIFSDLEDNVNYRVYLQGTANPGSNGFLGTFQNSDHAGGLEHAQGNKILLMEQEPPPTYTVTASDAIDAVMLYKNASLIPLGGYSGGNYWCVIDFWSDGYWTHYTTRYFNGWNRLWPVVDQEWNVLFGMSGIFPNAPNGYVRYDAELFCMLLFEPSGGKVYDQSFAGNQGELFEFGTGIDFVTTTSPWSLEEWDYVMELNGTNDYGKFLGTSEFNFGSGTFGIDTWIRLDDVTTDDYHGISGQYTDVNNQWRFSVEVDNSGSNVHIYLEHWDAGVETITLTYDWASGATVDAVAVDTWYHVMLCRGWNGNANDWAITIDGTAVATATNAAAWNDMPTRDWHIGADWIGGSGAGYLNGYMAAYRLNVGKTLWTADFEPPTTALRDFRIANTGSGDGEEFTGWAILYEHAQA